MTLGGTVTVVTAALVVAGGFSCVSLLNDKFSANDVTPGGQSIAYKTESASETKSNKWETAETALAALADSNYGAQPSSSGGKYRVASLQLNDRRSSAGSVAAERKGFPLHRFTDDGGNLT